MAASTKIRWRKYINELRHVHEEIEFIKEISKVSSREFQRHYEEYCTKNDIDLKELNKKHSQRINELYPTASVQPPPSHVEYSGSQMTIYKDHRAPESESYTQDGEGYKMTQDEMEIHESFNKVFRKLAMLLHPDKIPQDLTEPERDDMLGMFKEAKGAIENKKYFILLDLAQKFKITLPRNYQQQIRWMKKEIIYMEQDAMKHRDTYNYLFSECDSEEDKDQLVIKFMKQIFGPQVFAN